jgi:hypothetical protein
MVDGPDAECDGSSAACGAATTSAAGDDWRHSSAEGGT